jgi:hypothetical protein
MKIRQNPGNPPPRPPRRPALEPNPWTPTEVVVTGAAATGAALGLGYLGFDAGLGAGALAGLLLTRPGGSLLNNVTLGVKIGAVAGPVLGALGGVSLVYLLADALKNPSEVG